MRNVIGFAQVVVRTVEVVQVHVVSRMGTVVRAVTTVDHVADPEVVQKRSARKAGKELVVADEAPDEARIGAGGIESCR
jgi:hypothetical protein